mmetsp:Transcript_10214/g.27091  ORF Transcript_10214/g.27091 Transcript_10214/m.27091 type:complete len:82 (-) Transcript_10214:113-358(-)
MNFAAKLTFSDSCKTRGEARRHRNASFSSAPARPDLLESREFCELPREVFSPYSPTSLASASASGREAVAYSVKQQGQWSS